MNLSGMYLDDTRAVLQVKGDDARGFLQGLVSNDMGKVVPGRGIFAALLTPQGKIITDFFVAAHDGTFLIDVSKERAADLLRRLTLYRLRAKIAISDLSSTHASALAMGELPAPPEGVEIFPDPRDAALGQRLMGPRAALLHLVAAAPPLDLAAHERLRITRHVPASGDLEPERFFLLDVNFEETHGVDFRKGCYVGQEVTSRMKHRASTRKRLVAILGHGHGHAQTPPPGTPVMAADHAIGELRSAAITASGYVALAQLRLDHLADAIAAGTPLTCGGNRIEVDKDEWWRAVLPA